MSGASVGGGFTTDLDVFSPDNDGFEDVVQISYVLDRPGWALPGRPAVTAGGAAAGGAGARAGAAAAASAISSSESTAMAVSSTPSIGTSSDMMVCQLSWFEKERFDAASFKECID